METRHLPKLPDRLKVNKLVLNQEDFIEYILKHTNDLDHEFRVYESKHYIMVGINRIVEQPST